MANRIKRKTMVVRATVRCDFSEDTVELTLTKKIVNAVLPITLKSAVINGERKKNVTVKTIHEDITQAEVRYLNS